MAIYPDEKALPNDHEVKYNETYVVNGRQLQSPIEGTVADLKRRLFPGAKLKSVDVRNANMKARWADDRY